jgi:hypothetical protein
MTHYTLVEIENCLGMKFYNKLNLKFYVPSLTKNWNRMFNYKKFKKNHVSYLKNITLFLKTLIHRGGSRERLVPWSGLKYRFHQRGAVWVQVTITLPLTFYFKT